MYNKFTDYLILDDIPIDSIGRSVKALLGCQPIIVVTDKYVKKLTIPWGKPVIWCLNPDQDPRPTMDYQLREWFLENVFTYTLENKLY